MRKNHKNHKDRPSMHAPHRPVDGVRLARAKMSKMAKKVRSDILRQMENAAALLTFELGVLLMSPTQFMLEKESTDNIGRALSHVFAALNKIEMNGVSMFDVIDVEKLTVSRNMLVALAPVSKPEEVDAAFHKIFDFISTYGDDVSVQNITTLKLYSEAYPLQDVARWLMGQDSSYSSPDVETQWSPEEEESCKAAITDITKLLGVWLMQPPECTNVNTLWELVEAIQGMLPFIRKPFCEKARLIVARAEDYINARVRSLGRSVKVSQVFEAALKQPWAKPWSQGPFK